MGETAYDEFRNAYRSAYRNYWLADGSLLLEDREGALEFKARMHADVERVCEALRYIPPDDDDSEIEWLEIAGLEARLELAFGEKGL